MEQETILKKDGVKLVKKRLKELLKPLGFQPYPHSTTRLVRVREKFIDEVSLDTGGYHLNADYFIYLRSAPFARLTCDCGRLWRTTKEHITTHLQWYCEIPPEGGPYYYKPEHFEAVWQDVACVLERDILPQMEAMTEEVFLSRLLGCRGNDWDFFLPQDTVSLTSPYYRGAPETAIYGVSLWRQRKYGEGVPYLTFAREKYRAWLTDWKPKTERPDSYAEHFYLCHVRTEALLDELLSLWESREENWEAQAQERIAQVAPDWLEYLR